MLKIHRKAEHLYSCSLMASTVKRAVKNSVKHPVKHSVEHPVKLSLPQDMSDIPSNFSSSSSRLRENDRRTCFSVNQELSTSSTVTNGVTTETCLFLVILSSSLSLVSQCLSQCLSSSSRDPLVPQRERETKMNTRKRHPLRTPGKSL